MRKRTDEKKKMKKGIRGITLIALVITIVVLLILAGVSLNLVIGNNGIITKAGESKAANKYATIKDEYELYKSNQYIESVAGGSGGKTFSEFLADLQNRGILTDEDVAQINSENKLTISDKYEISFAKTLYDEVTDQNGSIKVGDYVTYTPDSTKTYKSETSENGWADQTYTVDTSTKWRVLGTEGNQVLLISADPIKKNMDADSENSWEQDPYLYMKGAYGYVNCVSMLDNICGIYSTSLGTAKSITADNINNVLGVKVESDKVYYESDPSTNIDMAGTFGKTYTYTSEDYSPESYINGKSHATEGEIVPRDGEAYAYYYDYTGTMATTIGNTTIGSLLFEGTQSGDNYAKSYWLASPGASVYSHYVNVGNGTVAGYSYAYFGPGFVSGGGVLAGYNLFNSNGAWYAGSFAVRPVVYLNSDVTVEQIQKTTGSTTTWSYRAGVVTRGSASDGEAGNRIYRNPNPVS